MRITQRKLYLILIIFFTGLVLLISGDGQIGIHIFSIVALAIGACIVSKFDFFHPMCWFPPFFALYSCAYPILYALGYNTRYGYTKESIVYSWLGLAVFLLFVSTEKLSIKMSFDHTDNQKSIGRIALLIIDLYLVFASVYISRSSFSGKTQIYNSHNPFLLLAFTLAYYVVIIYSNELHKKLKRNNTGKVDYLLLFSFSIVILFGLLTGERDYMFTILLISVLLLYFGKRLSKKQLLGLLPLGVILLPLSHVYKFYLLDKTVSGDLNSSNLLVEFFDGEFISASRNLQILVSNNYKYYFDGKTLLNDLIIPFYHTGFSVQTWFNETFFPTITTTQYGFTLVGEGYVNWGAPGVILVFASLSILVNYLYKYSNKNKYLMVSYMYMVPIIIYSSRADFANVLSPLLHYALLGALITYLMDRFDFKRSTKGM